jgi:DivIVA domain-containing protein
MHEGHGQHDHEHHGMAEETSQVPYPMRLVSHTCGGGWLTPAQVRGQVFSTVRLREGYEMGEVDTFLDRVEATLGAVLADNQDLRGRLSLAEQAAARAVAQAAQATQPGGDAGRIVALAQQAADQAITAAQEEATAIVARARERAETVVQQALDHGTHMRESLQAQARQLQSLLRELDLHDGALLTTLQSQPGSAESTAARAHPAHPPAVPAQPTPEDFNGHTPSTDGDRRGGER